MSSAQRNGEATPDLHAPREEERYAPWPDGKGGFAVLDLRTERPVAGPFPGPEEASDVADRWNAHPTPRVTPS